jgi:hypothetical protein
MREALEIIRLAKEHKATLVTGSCVPWKQDIQAAKYKTNQEKVQHYYSAGTCASFVWYMPDIFETIQMLVGGKVIQCSTHGVTWPADDDPLVIPPVMAHFVYQKTSTDRDPVIGVASNWRDNRSLRFWIKVHLDDDVIERCSYESGDKLVHDELLWLPFLRIIDRAFETGVWPEDEDYILHKVAMMLMAHKSGVEGGRPVSVDEIENHSLPRFITEKA